MTEWYNLVYVDHNSRAAMNSGKPPRAYLMLGMAQDYKIEASTPPKILQGRHLIKMGFKPGKAFGEVLRPAYTAQLEGEFKTITEAYFWLGQHQDLLANLAS